MPIDYPEFIETLLSQKMITAKKYAEYVEDEYALPNEISDGKEVLSLGWDGDYPGGSGAIYVNCWKGFYFCNSSDYDPEGPFASLDEALDMEWFHTVTSNPDLSSEVLPLKTLLGIGGWLVSDDGGEIYINSNLYVVKAGKLVRSR